MGRRVLTCRDMIIANYLACQDGMSYDKGFYIEKLAILIILWNYYKVQVQSMTIDSENENLIQIGAAAGPKNCVSDCIIGNM